MDYCYGPGRNLVVDGCLVLHGMVGGAYWDEGFTSTDVVQSLAALGPSANVTVRINSSGGIAHEGLAIHAILSAHRGRVTTVVEGIACSAASIIAQAGAERVMASGAMMMVHDAAVWTEGDAAEHRASLNYLEVVCASMAAVYAGATKRSVEEVRAEMAAETWMTAEEAVAKGYADRLGAANDDEPAPFPFRAYARAPQRLVAMADAKGWSKRPLPTATATAAAPPQRHQESSMPNDPAGKPPVKPSNVIDLDAARAEGRVEAMATALPRTAASEIASLCHASGVPEMAAGLLAAGATVEHARARIETARQIKDVVALARRANPEIPEATAAALIAEGKTVDQARAALFDRMVERDEATAVSTRRAPGGEAASGGGASATVNNMRAQLERRGLLKKGA